jgi:subtilisin family serine protease
MTVRNIFLKFIRHPLTIFVVFSCIIIAIAVPIAYLLKPTNHDKDILNNTNRLIVNFKVTNKSVKSILPPILWEFLKEQHILSSDIRVVSFSDNLVLKEVRDLLEKDFDLANILEDQVLWKAPIHNDINISLIQKRLLNENISLFSKELWHLNTIGAKNAWTISKGVQDIIVAVIDTGCDIEHHDLKSNLWKNTREIPDNGIDDDNNGYIDDVYGYDFAGECRSDWRLQTTTLCGGKPMTKDTHSHGTHCAGIISAIGIGVSGIAPNVKVMCLKVADVDGVFYLSHILKAFDYALQMNAHIISCSFGPAFPNINPTILQLSQMQNETRFYEMALKPLQEKDILIVAAAGNENTNLNQLIEISSTYNPCTLNRIESLASNIICVLATDQLDQRWYEILRNNQPVGSNFGNNIVDVGAPGRIILSTVPRLISNNYFEYDTKTGSSMATPLVAGTTALVLSILGRNNKSYYQGSTARQIILDSVVRVSSLEYAIKSKGIINAERAVKSALTYINNIIDLYPIENGWNLSNQGVVVQGWIESYYTINNNGDVISLKDIITRSGPSRFDTYRHTSNSILLIANSTFVALDPGMYRIYVKSKAKVEDVTINFGYRTMSLKELLMGINISIPYSGYYQFELYYRNPIEYIDILFSTPTQPNYLNTLSDNFLYSLRHQSLPIIFNGPNLNLSNVFHTLYNVIEDASNIPLLHSLQLNAKYKYSSVWEDVNNGLFHNALKIDEFDKAHGTHLIGIAYTRIRCQSQDIAFFITCTHCMLSINNLIIANVYNTTLKSGCIRCLKNSYQDLTLRYSFRLQDIYNEHINIKWSICKDSKPLIRSIKDIISNPLLWKPTSNVVGYIGGVQCDVWSSNITYVFVGSEPPRGEPYLKFRLPSALANSNRMTTLKHCIPQNRIMNETFESNCVINFTFSLRDIYKSLPSLTSLNIGQLFERFYMRCWTYIRRGAIDGRLVPRITTTPSTIYLGSQLIYVYSHPSEIVSNNGIPIAPQVTNLENYYQLLVYETRYQAGMSIIELLEGQGMPLQIHLSDFMLPITTFKDNKHISKPPSYPLSRPPLPRPPPPKKKKQPLRKTNRGLNEITYDVKSKFNIVQFGFNASAFYETGFGLSSIGFNRLDLNGIYPKEVAFANNIGLNELVYFNLTQSQEGLPKYVRIQGNLSIPLYQNSIKLIVNEIKYQCIGIIFGDITIVNANECPSTSIKQHIIEIIIPNTFTHMIPVGIIVRTTRTGFPFWNTLIHL